MEAAIENEVLSITSQNILTQDQTNKNIHKCNCFKSNQLDFLNHERNLSIHQPRATAAIENKLLSTTSQNIRTQDQTNKKQTKKT